MRFSFLDVMAALLLCTALDTNPIKVAFCMMVFFQVFTERKQLEPSINIATSMVGIYAYSAFIAIFYLIFGTAVVSVDNNAQLLSVRKGVIDVLFAVAVYYHFRQKNLQEIAKIISLGLIANLIYSVFELPYALANKERPSLLFYEPSSLAFFYVWIAFTMPILFNYADKVRAVFFSFLAVGLLCGSKALYPLVLLGAFIKSNIRQKVFIVIAVAVISAVFWEYLVGFYFFLVDTNNQVSGFHLMLLSLYDLGVQGLSNRYGVNDTYVTRMSAIYSALVVFIQNPFGVGIGIFNILYKEELVLSGLSESFIGSELDTIFAGSGWASAKSALLEHLVSTGVFGLAWLVVVGKKLCRNRAVFIAYIMTLISATVLELNPFLAYVMVLVVIAEKITGSEQCQSV